MHFIIDGKISIIPTRMSYSQANEEEFQNIRFEVQINNSPFQSQSSGSVEYALKHLQTELPDNIKIACCQSCRHGNFNPYGDSDNEIFCFKDKIFRNRDDVVEIYSKQDSSIDKRRRKLHDFCKSYQPVSRNVKYTYNDWDIE